jgi:hypothetical protein
VFSTVKTQRWKNGTTNPDVAIVVDAGDAHDELRGVEPVGRATIVGDAPLSDESCEKLVEQSEYFARKYTGPDDFVTDRRQAWLRVDVLEITSRDFRKPVDLATS